MSAGWSKPNKAKKLSSNWAGFVVKTWQPCHYCFLCYYRSFDMFFFSIYAFFKLNHSSVHLWRMLAVNHTQLLANHSSGRLLHNLQSATAIKTEHTDEGIKNRTENSLLLLNYDVFGCKNLDQFISGPQSTEQNHFKKAVHDPFIIIALILCFSFRE